MVIQCLSKSLDPTVPENLRLQPPPDSEQVPEALWPETPLQALGAKSQRLKLPFIVSEQTSNVLNMHLLFIDSSGKNFRKPRKLNHYWPNNFQKMTWLDGITNSMDMSFGGFRSW